MDKQILTNLRSLCRPLYNLKPFVKAVWVYGSVVKKKNVKTSDIDLLVLVDDTVENLDVDKMVGVTKAIELTAEKKKIKIHFQPPKKLTLWWDLVRTGEPWTITSLRNSVIIYDPSGYATLLKKLLQKGEIYSTEQRAEKLIELAKSRINDIRQIALEKVPFEILMAMTESAQMALMYYKKFPPAPRNIACELRNAFVQKGLLPNSIVESYEDMFDTVLKIQKGTLSEFNGKDIDKSLNRAKIFLTVIEKLLLSLEHKRREKGMEESYKTCMELCNKALKKKIKNLPKNDLDRIKLFRKKFVDTKLVGKSHYTTLADLYEYRTSKRRRKSLEKEKYLDGTYIRSLKIAMKDIL